jgi:hypothetical protein
VARENAPVSDAREGAISGQLGQLVLHLFPNLGGEIGISQEHLEKLVLQLALGCQLSVLVIMDVAVLSLDLHKLA